jgi:hypothetical protein
MIRKVLQSEIWSLSGEDHCRFMKRSTVKKRPVTRDNIIIIIIIISTAVWSSVKLEAWAVGFTAGSREVPGRKDLWQETFIITIIIITTIIIIIIITEHQGTTESNHIGPRASESTNVKVQKI